MSNFYIPAIKRASTGLTGLPVARTPFRHLSVIYDKTLKVLGKFPAHCEYKQNTEVIVKERLAAVNEETDVAKLEKRINSGIIEEVLLQAERELTLARRMLYFKPWEPLIEKAPETQWRWPLN